MKAQRLYDVNGESPGLEIEHHIRKDPIVIRSDFFAMICMSYWNVEDFGSTIGVAYLQIHMCVELGFIVSIV